MASATLLHHGVHYIIIENKKKQREKKKKAKEKTNCGGENVERTLVMFLGITER